MDPWIVAPASALNVLPAYHDATAGSKNSMSAFELNSKTPLVPKGGDQVKRQLFSKADSKSFSSWTKQIWITFQLDKSLKQGLSNVTHRNPHMGLLQIQ